MSAADDFAEVRHAVARLTVAQRSVVYVAFWEDLPERAIADLLGVSPGGPPKSPWWSAAVADRH